jgi:hypothetical protein
MALHIIEAFKTLNPSNTNGLFAYTTHSAIPPGEAHLNTTSFPAQLTVSVSK